MGTSFDRQNGNCGIGVLSRKLECDHYEVEEYGHKQQAEIHPR